ncbi:transglycosylase SLT domain-containing protein [Clostridium sp.]|uniref:transglycosylase SLT domain-containing protein n=1 Tax=Clostridium sp. TaxID=1506 RepID=UPI0026213A79|nr:transglycosylase SLT domain-containing protein [Clostridium sp.]
MKGIGAAEEKTQISGNTLANAMKTIGARVTQVKTDNLQPTTREMANAEKAMNAVGISIRDTHGELLPLQDDLTALAQKWGTLDSVQKSNLSYYIAGTRQVSILEGLMGSYAQSVDLTNDAINNNNQAMKDNANFTDSFTGRLNTLQTTFELFATQTLNGDWFKNGVTGLTDLLYGIKDLITNTPLLTVAMLALFASLEKVALAQNFLWINSIKTGITGLITSIGELSVAFTADAEEMGVMATATGLLTVGIESLATAAGSAIIAMATNPLTWIAVAIGGVAALTNAWQQQQQTLQTLKQTYNDYSNAIKKDDMSGLQTSVTEMKQEQSNLNNLFSSSVKEGLSSNPIDMIKSFMDKNSYDSQIQELNNLGLTYDTTTGKIKQLQSAQNELSGNDKLTQALREISNNSDVAGSSIGKLITSYINLAQQSDKSSTEQKQQTDYANQLKQQFSDLTLETDKNGNTIIKNTDALEAHAGELVSNTSDLQKYSSVTQSATQSQDNLTKSLTTATSTIKDYSKYIKDMDSNSGTLSATNVQDILKNHQELIPYLSNEKELYQQIQQAISNETQSAQNDYKQLLETSADYYNVNIRNNATMINEFKKQYGVDLSSYNTLADAKQAIQSQLHANLSKAESDYAKAQAEVNKAQAAEQALESAQAIKNTFQSVLPGVINDAVGGLTNNVYNTLKSGADKNLAKAKTDEQNALNTLNTDKSADDLKTQQALADLEKPINTSSSQIISDMASSSEGTDSTSGTKTANTKAIDAQIKALEEAKTAYNTSADNAYKVEKQQENAIIKGYQDQLSALQQKNTLQSDNNELLKDQNALIKDQQSLQNAINDKSVRVFEDGQWQWASNQTKVQQAMDTLSQAQDTLNTKQADIAEKAQENTLKAEIKTEQDKESAYQTNYQNNKNATDQNYQSQEDVLNDRKEQLQGYAVGTDNATTGIHPVSENGMELVIGNQLKDFQGGEQVLNNTDTLNFLNNNLSSSADNNSIDISQSVQTTAQNIGDAINDNKQLIQNPVTNLKTEIENEIQKFVDGSNQYSINTNKNIGDSINNSSTSVTTPMQQLITNVKTMITEFTNGTNENGKQINIQIGKGINDSTPDLTKNINDLCTNIENQFRTDLGIHSPSTVMHEIGTYMMQGLINGMNEADIESFISNKLNNTINTANITVSGNVQQWLKQAIQATGTSSSWLSDLEIIAEKESSGNPNSINLTDINAQEGHPSQGLMQMIPSTFQEYMMNGHNNINNPIDNAIAAINYIKARYGTITNVPGIKSMMSGGSYVGYEQGTDNATTGIHPVSENGMELVIGNQLKDFQGGEQVLNNTDTLNFLNRLNNINSLTPSYSLNNVPSTNNNTTSNTYNISKIELPNVTRPDTFVAQLEQIVATNYMT